MYELKYSIIDFLTKSYLLSKKIQHKNIYIEPIYMLI